MSARDSNASSERDSPPFGYGHTDTDREAYRLIVGHYPGLVTNLPDFFGNPNRLFSRYICQHDAHFLSAQPSDQITFAKKMQQRGSEKCQHLVAPFVSIPVIDLLEMIQIHVKYRDVFVPEMGYFELFVPLFKKSGTRHQTRKRIVHGE